MDYSAIATAFSQHFGVRQLPDSSGIQLTTLATANSGLFLDDIHPMINGSNLEAISPNFNVLMDGDLQADINTAFDDWIKTKIEGYISLGIRTWVAKKTNLNETKSIIENGRWVETSNNYTFGSVTDVSANDRVGIAIESNKGKYLRTKVKRIALQLETSQTIQIDLHRADTAAPIATYSAVYTGAGDVQWFDLTDWVLDQSGANYYISYQVLSLTDSPINGLFDFGVNSSGTTHSVSPKNSRINGFSVKNTASATDIWDQSANSYISDNNYGINIEYDTYCDLTQFVVDQLSNLELMIYYFVGINLIKEIKNNPYGRVNLYANNFTIESLDFELYGDPRGADDFSVSGMYKAAFEAARFNNSSLDRQCLSCKKNGIRIKQV
jgi:hypothetical protein